MKLGVIVGHTNNSKGAWSDTLGQAEYTWNRHLAELIEDIATSVEIKTFLRDGHGIAGAYAASDAFGANLTVELHFNASHNDQATGTGVLYYPGSKNGRRFSKFLFDELSQVLGLRDWPKGSGGVVTPFQASGQQRRGLRSLSAGRAPAALIEPFFGSNPQDSATAQSSKQDMAQAIVRAAERQFAA